MVNKVHSRKQYYVTPMSNKEKGNLAVGKYVLFTEMVASFGEQCSPKSTNSTDVVNSGHQRLHGLPRLMACVVSSAQSTKLRRHKF